MTDETDRSHKEQDNVVELERVDWNVELVRGDLGRAVQRLKRESGKGLLLGGVELPLALAELGLIAPGMLR
jgi:hypothetical protein